jgi:hypothetical protein
VRFFRRFKRMLDARNLTVKGITTDGSPLYPEPIAEVFGDIEHANFNLKRNAQVWSRTLPSDLLGSW